MEHVHTPLPYTTSRSKVIESVKSAQNRFRFSTDRAVVELARETAYQVASILPPGFEGVMPRGYTLKGGDLVMTKMPTANTLSVPLYGCHSCWSLAEASAFVEDLKSGWLHDLASYMRWQLRDKPERAQRFQSALRSIRAQF